MAVYIVYVVLWYAGTSCRESSTMAYDFGRCSVDNNEVYDDGPSCMSAAEESTLTEFPDKN